MPDLSWDDIEIRAIREAYDALKCLDDAGRQRAMQWLWSKFADEEREGKAAREQSARTRIAARSAREPQAR